MTTNLIDNPTLNYLGLLIPILPLVGYLVNGLLGKFLPKGITGWIGSLTVLGSFICTFIIFNKLGANDAIRLDLFHWITFGQLDINFGFWFDPLTMIMLLVVTGVGFLIHLYSIGYMHDDEGFTRFFSYLNLFIFFMLLLVLGSNYLIMFIGWEGVGLCSYLLIGFWFKNDSYNDAAQKAFVMNRIGDLGFLLGMFFLLFNFGTLDIKAIESIAPGMVMNGSLVVMITMCLFIGAMGKSAQIPLYTWLPDAMAGPTPVSALIHAATMVTAGIYMVVRSNVLFAMAPTTMDVILWVGVATSVLAAVIGLKQNDIKKVLAYSTVSQLGLMFAALGVGAFSSGIFHLVTHAFFKALLFLGAGSVIHALHGEQDIRKMGGLKKYIPITYITFLLAALAISGFPLLSGFFSKDEILAHDFEHGKIIWAILSVSSLITAFYMFRLVFLTFFNTYRGSEESKHHIHESPWTITVPLIILCVCSVLGGLLNLPDLVKSNHWMSHYLSAVTAPSAELIKEHEPLSHGMELVLMSIAGLGAIIMILYARYVYITKKAMPEEESALTGLPKLVSNKFYVDELYDKLITKPVFKLSEWWGQFVDKLVIDRGVNGVAKSLEVGGKTLRLFQNGHTGFYVFAMVLGMVVFFIIRLLI
ncbi:MAG TPA: NADH-quinone oxidoreductase subunit L [Saprospiraceae bacterium]|nr:NADH-quinone oxidoreductase subunit L [Saprospiraceae bacterium]